MLPFAYGHPRSSGRFSDFPFEALPQEYLQLPYEEYLSVPPSGVTLVNFAPQITSEERNHKH
jgi:hypothetical protein